MTQQYAFENKSKVYVVYFGLLGIVVLSAGIADLIVTISSSTFSYALIQIPGGGFRGGWGGLIMIFAGIFYLSGIRDAHEIHQFAKVVLGSVLLWVMAGTDILAMVFNSIPSQEPDRWFNSLEDFLLCYAPPYTPAVLLLPFSLAIIYYIHLYHREKGITFTFSSHEEQKAS
jgi:hypothetical protein